MHQITAVSFDRADRPKGQKDKISVTDVGNVTPGYLELLGIPLLKGRTLTPNDVARNRGKGDGVLVVNQSFVDTHLPGEDPLRVRILLDDGKRAYQIVGVVANFRAMGADEDIRPQFFRAGVDTSNAILVLRTAVPPETLADDSRALLWSLDKELVSARVGTMAGYIDESLQLRWFGLVLMAAFAGLALLLAMIGVYSVLANLVASRTREIGIRMALGAAPAVIGRMIASQSLRPVLIGLVVGVAASLALGQVLNSMLFEVTSRDPLTLTLSVAGVLLMTPLAILVPLRRATRVECTEALREE
jgi:putative ABC transport system permease protein